MSDERSDAGRGAGEAERAISEVLPSYYFAPYAMVLVTECGHRHVRPTAMAHKVGDMLACPFCEDAAPHGQPSDIGADVPGGGAV
jgi:hypothetical protein